MTIAGRIGILIFGIVLWKLFMWDFDKHHNHHGKGECKNELKR